MEYTFSGKIYKVSKFKTFLTNQSKSQLNFKLDQLYQQHSDHLLELIIKSNVSYSDEYDS
ncbi:hypothetical protein SAMN05421800_12243 [Chryseobacterium balustinum]|uniref:Uncharacterized protein n=1 Tax=Chryseobacterium balustinum TaxID=246 RepID=A0AAX2IME2_9FLAO|nr:hypothetical protein SAMN05421800_12243 [Chryseobacterium balustinum]SQA90914.1 Uncharacterised protein [Chryseobacterium balustinum]